MKTLQEKNSLKSFLLQELSHKSLHTVTTEVGLQNSNSGTMVSEEFRSFHLYLPPEEYQDVLSERYKHIFRSIDKTQNEVRVYVKGLDFWEHDYDLPFATLNGKKKSFENLWKEAIGEKIIEE